MYPRFTPWTTIYRYCRRWEVGGVVERKHDVLRSIVRGREGKNPKPSAGIIDSQTIKSAPQDFDSVGYPNVRKSCWSPLDTERLAA
jgi:hypothetical protein